MARIALKENPVIVSYYTNEKNTRSVVHSHSYHELVYNISGSSVIYSTDRSQFTLRKGDVIFFPSEHFHSGIYNVNDSYSVRLVVQIDTSVWERAKERSNIVFEDQSFLIDSETAAKWDFRGLFERMAQTAYVEKSAQPLIYEAQVLELQLLIGQFLKQNGKSPLCAKNSIVDRAIEYLQQNYTNPAFSVEELAGLVCVSRAHLSRLFKAYTLESVHEYLTGIRMQHCRRLIADGKSILDSVIESGFSDYSSFVKTFKKLYGMTPQGFRKMLKKEITKEAKKI